MFCLNNKLRALLLWYEKFSIIGNESVEKATPPGRKLAEDMCALRHITAHDTCT